ncbi:MAG: MerC domain-containing protein [Bacteroidota bacterium]
MKNSFVALHVDFVGFCSSVLCALHCALTPVLLSLLPLAGLQFLTNPAIEYSLIFISIVIASLALFRGYSQHHKDPLPLVVVGYGFLLITLGRFAHAEWQEVFFSSAGAISVAAAHVVNWVRIKQHVAKTLLKS